MLVQFGIKIFTAVLTCARTQSHLWRPRHIMVQTWSNSMFNYRRILYP